MKTETTIKTVPDDLKETPVRITVCSHVADRGKIVLRFQEKELVLEARHLQVAIENAINA
jgi:hypothetical protein